MPRTLIASDDFNRASLGANWAQAGPILPGGFLADLRIRSSLYAEASGQGADAVGRWVGAGSFEANQFAKATLANVGYWGVSTRAGVAVCVQPNRGTVSAPESSYYAVRVHGDASGAKTTSLVRVVNAVETVLASTTMTWSTGDTIELERDGTTLRPYRNGSAIAALTVSDSAISGGVPGALCRAAGAIYLDDWSGGNITAGGSGPAGPTFSGSIGGISATQGQAIAGVNVAGLFAGTGLSFTAVGSWPAGITVSPAGIISGTTSAAAGTYGGLSVRATDSSGQSVLSNAFAITVAAPASGGGGGGGVATLVNLQLTTDGTTPAANVTGLRWAFFDQPTPDALASPTAKGSNASTNASGLLSLSIAGTALPPGGTGWLVVSNSNGSAAGTHSAFAGPVITS